MFFEFNTNWLLLIIQDGFRLNKRFKSIFIKAQKVFICYIYEGFY